MGMRYAHFLYICITKINKMKTRKIRKITLAIIFTVFLAEKHIDKELTNYNAWIVVFLFWIAYNTTNLEDDNK